MESRPDSKLDALVKTTRVAMHIAVVFAVIVGLSIARDWHRTLRDEQRITQLAHAGDMGAFAAQYMKLSDDTAAFLKQLPPDCGKDSPCLPAPRDLFAASSGIGREMYFSAPLSRFREIGNSYDVLGALVRQGYLDFDFVYTVVIFPDDFWDRTREYRRLIQTRWDVNTTSKDTNCGKAVEARPQDCYDAKPDFWANFSWLRDQVLKQRRKISP